MHRCYNGNLVFLDDEDARLTSPNAPQILKCVPSKQTSIPDMGSPMKEVIFELLNALSAKYTFNKEDSSNGEVRQAQALAEALQEVLNDHNRDMHDHTPQFRSSGSQEDTPEAPVHTTA